MVFGIRPKMVPDQSPISQGAHAPKGQSKITKKVVALAEKMKLKYTKVKDDFDFHATSSLYDDQALLNEFKSTKVFKEFKRLKSPILRLTFLTNFACF